jgi:hypothetical protein
VENEAAGGKSGESCGEVADVEQGGLLRIAAQEG